jgi:hypothetical protein
MAIDEDGTIDDLKDATVGAVSELTKKQAKECAAQETRGITGLFDKEEETRIKPFLKEAILQKQKQIMKEERKEYIKSNLEARKRSFLDG